jgi:hypothetical protein
MVSAVEIECLHKMIEIQTGNPGSRIDEDVAASGLWREPWAQDDDGDTGGPGNED